LKRSREKKELYVNCQIALIEDVHELSKEVEKLGLLWNQLNTDEIGEKLAELKKRATSLEGREIPKQARKVREHALSHLEDLRFEYVFPIVKELKSDSLEPTFASRMGQIAEKMREQNSLSPFQQLNSLQQKEITQEGA
jgi:hypothetical protein